jgi:general secretion pathway protein H
MSSPGRISSSSGFTLVEVLAVLLLVAAAVTLAVPRVAGMMGDLARRRDVGDFVFLLRRARIEALERGRTVRVARAEETLVVAAEGREEPILTFVIPAGLVLPEGVFPPGVEFYPLGNSSGMKATVTTGGDPYLVRVDPLTGEVDSAPAKREGGG